MDCKERLRDCFDEMVVYKDLKKTNFFSALSLPSFMRDWLLKKFEDENGNFDKDDMVRFVKKYIPRKDDWTSIKNRVIVEGERVKFLAKISIDIDVKMNCSNQIIAIVYSRRYILFCAPHVIQIDFVVGLIRTFCSIPFFVNYNTDTLGVVCIRNVQLNCGSQTAVTIYFIGIKQLDNQITLLLQR